MDKYVFDKEKGVFLPKRATFGGVMLSILKYLLASLGAALLFYAVFALAFDTEREERLSRENSLLSEEYSLLTQELDMLDGAVGDLRLRDREIYNNLFGADPPSYIVETRDTLLAGFEDLESIPEEDLVWDAWAVASRTESLASQVSASLALIDTVLRSPGAAPTALPSIVPVRGFSPMQLGASVGKKIHPFYKTVREHSGLDIVAPSGTQVLCSADGKVVATDHSQKGMGNTVTVEHPGGFRTRYCHLEDIKVNAGQNVRQGSVLGTVGQTGSCFAPCLHYEVWRDGRVQDPVNYFFAQLDPATYHDMMIVALTTGQSLD
ncbi:MAG: M23 family metallopeptidase [Bacteroidales bacterium]|nr:M23 family metallopeptidase [Bacteroidales bacterium]